MLEPSETTRLSTLSTERGPTLARVANGRIESAADVVALRRFVGLTQKQFAGAMGISVHTLRNWEQGRRTPDGPALALLRIAARHPQIVRENVCPEVLQPVPPPVVALS